MKPTDPHANVPLPGRRRLLTAAAGAGALGLFSGISTAAGAPKRVAPRRGKSFTQVQDGEPLKIGLIGTGGMGTGHCHALVNLNKAGRERLDLVAVSDVATPRMGDAARVMGEKQGFEVAQYQNYKDLLARDDIHGVLIASPEHWHAQMAIDAILAGKDVYCEKPMTYDLEDAVRLMDVVHANEQILQVGTQKMMMPKFAKARELIQAGTIGKPVWSQTSYCRNSPDGEWNYYQVDPRVVPGETLDWQAWCGPLGVKEWDELVYWRWRRYHEYSTGIIGDLLVHVMTPLIWAVDAGYPTRVTALGGHYVDKAMDNFDQVNLTLQFENDHTMIVAGSTCNDTGLETLVRGDMADMYLGGNNVSVTPQRPYVDDVDPEQHSFGGINDQDELRLNWMKCMRTREENASTVDHAMKVMVAVDLAHRSMWEGTSFAFDPETLTAKAL
ncbi:MAG: Gfo/Idh/MocA family oxidoreductase [Planctomycetota bacterium]|nr:Gfo/Idh/MocA family oxidoreductase [Planctomycetota bacterium]